MIVLCIALYVPIIVTSAQTSYCISVKFEVIKGRWYWPKLYTFF